MFFRFFLVLSLFLVSCRTTPLERIEVARRIARTSNMERRTMKAGDFILTAFVRMTNKNAPVVVYIEGDGLAFMGRKGISPDPTPNNPTALELATIDASPNVVYLARPCQYAADTQITGCSNIYWSSHRFAPEVVKSMNVAVDFFAKRAEGVHLVGYSGGGAIATIIATERDDVLSLRTVAANLDHNAVNKHHKVPMQYGSLNALDYASKLKNMPQIHYSGAEDKTVPTFIAQSFVQAVGSSKCTRVFEAKGINHYSGWDKLWKNEYNTIPSCN